MAITTYSELKTAIANWLNRDDLTSRIPEFIALAESRLVRDAMLRTMEVDSALTGSVGSRAIALPTGFVEAYVLWREDTTGRVKLRFVLPEEMTTNATDGEPEYWTVDGGYIKFERELDSAYSFTLRNRQFSALSDSNTSNSLLASYPDAYLQSSLVEGFSYLFDPQAASLWDGRYRVTRDEINDLEARNRSQSTLSVDSALLPRSGMGSFNINTGA